MLLHLLLALTRWKTSCALTGISALHTLYGDHHIQPAAGVSCTQQLTAPYLSNVKGKRSLLMLLKSPEMLPVQTTKTLGCIVDTPILHAAFKDLWKNTKL